MPSFFIAWALVALSAAPPPAPPQVRLALPALMEKARKQPTVEAAQAAAQEAHAKAREASRSWWPQLEVTAVGGPSQRLRCVPDADHCVQTEPSGQTQLGFAGIFGRLDAKLTMPLYTFGKISSAKRAAEAGAQASDALVEQSEHDAAFDVARAYFAVKLGRELMVMLKEGLGYLQDEVAREEKLLEKGSGEITEADHRRVLSLRAEIEARLSEAKKVEELGLAGVHFTLGTSEADIDEAPLAPVVFELPTLEEARRLALGRPEERAAERGADATARLVDLEWRRWWPDFVLVGAGTLAGSTSVEHPNNAFLSDPYNSKSGALGIALRWAPDFGTRGPKIDQAEAVAAKARAGVQLARQGLAADAERALAEARDARDRMASARTGQRHAKAWLASVAQSEAAGLAEPKDLSDALVQYFGQHARLIQATFDWNVGVMAFQRAIGQMPESLRTVEED